MISLLRIVALLIAAIVSLSAAQALPLTTTLKDAALATESLQGVQACPPGYNYSYRRGGCYPAYRDNYRRRHGGYRGGGYWACPPGTNPDGAGRCIYSGGVACPPGFNALAGRCYRNY